MLLEVPFYKLGKTIKFDRTSIIAIIPSPNFSMFFRGLVKKKFRLQDIFSFISGTLNYNSNIHDSSGPRIFSTSNGWVKIGLLFLSSSEKLSFEKFFITGLEGQL